jgi:hypothetical protein
MTNQYTSDISADLITELILTPLIDFGDSKIQTVINTAISINNISGIPDITRRHLHECIKIGFSKFSIAAYKSSSVIWEDTISVFLLAETINKGLAEDVDVDFEGVITTLINECSDKVDIISSNLQALISVLGRDKDIVNNVIDVYNTIISAYNFDINTANNWLAATA